ncbi:transcriptional regulator GcvA [uncultured Sneathiella sp.]|jgi:LysR family glycine cleavage system transcriptional activator|uniref:transcriptional regulator GcvA n=1 Tax=uncultured Sneathiella sp. TaxID=879315 RepID=UPI0030D90150|tara:strand:+ start:182 stop:1102 length:921 start_codon:yes stop_codon:yes gene_type:complete
MRFPPLKALRSFEAAARHLSFSKAAEELFVTPAAVSHQVKALEDWLGVILFKRLNRAVILTNEGQNYVMGVRNGLEIIGAATEKIMLQDASGALHVDTLPSFAARWLLPRLSRFREAHPDIDVRLSASDHLTDFNREDVDVVIRYGHGHYPGLRVNKLLTEELMFPVCSPNLLEGKHPLRHPNDLKYHTLLHDDMRIDWQAWLAMAGVTGVDPKKGPSFNDSSMLLTAAMEGQGVALGRSTLAADDLMAGRLVQPFNIQPMQADHAYYIVSPEEAADRPRIAAFREWIMEEASVNSGRFKSRIEQA